ncbi:MAG: hypothetical protein K0R84_2284 [Clostridia bacterium]|nr:hypothetical protein [Clostridia bacterium]
MQCKQIDELMMKYFDGNISELEMEQLTRHHQKCKTCSEEFEVLREALFEIEELPDIEPPAELTVKIMTAVQSQKQFQLNKKQLISWIVGFAGLVLFTYNIIAFAVLPMISGGVNLLSVEGMLQMVSWIGDMLKEGLIALSVAIGKLLVIRDIIFRDYAILIIVWAAAFSAVQLMLFRLMRVEDKKNNYVKN